MMAYSPFKKSGNGGGLNYFKSIMPMSIDDYNEMKIFPRKPFQIQRCQLSPITVFCAHLHNSISGLPSPMMAYSPFKKSGNGGGLKHFKSIMPMSIEDYNEMKIFPRKPFQIQRCQLSPITVFCAHLHNSISGLPSPMMAYSPFKKSGNGGGLKHFK